LVPIEACRFAGLSTIGPPTSDMNARTSAGPSTSTDRGLGMPAAEVTRRRSCLLRSASAAP
jgi:hypothetical protein